MTMQANLTNRDAVGRAAAVRQVVLRAAARRRTSPPPLARAIHTASLPPRGPAFVSIPMDDWDAECEPFPARTVTAARRART